MTSSEPIRLPRPTVLVGFFAFGCVAALGQILLLREFLVSFHGTEVAVGAFYGSWFLWIAIGAWWGPRALGRVASDAVAYMGLHLAFPVAVLAEIVLLRTLRSIMGVDPQRLLPMETLLISALLLTAPVGAIIGALFPVTGRLLKGPSRDPVTLGYVWESAGSLAGGVAFTYLLATRFDPLVTLAAMGLIEGATVLLVAWGGRSRRGMVAATLGLLAYASLLTPLGAALNQATERARWRSLQEGYELVAVRHTPYSHVAVGRDPSGQYGLFFDGIQRAVFPDPSSYSQEASFALAQHPGARRILVLSGGSEGLVQELLRFPVERIDCLEDDPWALALVRRYLPEADRRALSDGRVRIISQDGRLFVNHRGEGQRYDLVLSRAAHPSTASQNRYFTREFFEGVRAMLRPGGVFLLQTVEPRPAAGQALLRTAASVLHTLGDVFSHVALVSHKGTMFAASVAPGRVTSNPEELGRRLSAIPMPGAAERAEALLGSVSAEISREFRAQLDVTPVAQNADMRPTTYFHALQLWGRDSGSELPRLFAAFERAGVWLFVVILVVIGLGRLTYRVVVPNPARSQRTNTAIAIGVTGFAAMSLQVMILMGFQSHLGSLYQKVGVLNGAFMMGLAGGALAGRAAAGRIRAPRLVLGLSLGVLALFSLLVPATMEWVGREGNGLVAAIYFGLSGLAGVVTGALFPLSVATYDPKDEDVGHTASVMNAADHVGASLGGLLAGTVIVPVAGQYITAQVVAFAALVPGVLLCLDYLMARRGWRQVPVSPRRLSFPWVRFSWMMGATVVAVLACAALVRCRPPVEDPATVKRPFPHRVFQEGARGGPHGGQPGSETGAAAPSKAVRNGTPGVSPESRGRPTAVGFETRHVAPEVHGYGGPMNLWVRFDSRGTLEQVLLREHRETPSYIRGLPAWLRLLEGHALGRPFRGPGGVDVLSGATVTCEAILRVLERSRERAARELLGLSPGRSPPPPPSLFSRLFGSWRSWVVLVGLLLMIPVHFWGGWRSRLGYMAVAAAVYGVWLNVPFTLVDLASLGSGVLPGAGEKGVLVLGVLALSAAFGQVWCGLGCPFGAMQELPWLILHPSGRFGSAGLGGARRFQGDLEERARYLKFCILALALVFFSLSGDAAYLALDPMTAAFVGKVSGAALVLLVCVGLASLWVFRPFCRYLCPAGAFLALFNKVRLLGGLAPSRPVARCDLGVTSPVHVDCIQCHRCRSESAGPPST